MTRISLSHALDASPRAISGLITDHLGSTAGRWPSETPGLAQCRAAELTQVGNDWRKDWPWTWFTATERWAALVDETAWGLGTTPPTKDSR